MIDKKKIVILGSTGSIGKNTLEVIGMFPDRFEVLGLSTNNSTDLLLEQVRRFKPPFVAIANHESYKKVKESLDLEGCRVLDGKDGLVEMATLENADIVVASIVGSAGLIPTYSALKAGKTVALANKEVLVSAGKIFTKIAGTKSSKILPVDSEHSALFQCLQGQSTKSIKRLLLTASGGPFFGWKKEMLKGVTVDEALCHPNWTMGKKITIDSATLMNKGLEIIEAHHLFGIEHRNIEAIIHRQSIVHSLVEFTDGSIICQMSNPDMKGPIAYALSYPERLDGVMRQVDLISLGTLTFEKPDTEAFPCLKLAYSALDIGATMPAVLNAANEVAVESFLKGRIGFNQIPVIIDKVMSLHNPICSEDIEAILDVDKWARIKAKEVI
ncbi:MAG: 1-deoxy-D-xylulose-5-phosphate reductoisomerase [Thermodesulfovibrionales bacterium]